MRYHEIINEDIKKKPIDTKSWVNLKKKKLTFIERELNEISSGFSDMSSEDYLNVDDYIYRTHNGNVGLGDYEYFVNSFDRIFYFSTIMTNLNGFSPTSSPRYILNAIDSIEFNDERLIAILKGPSEDTRGGGYFVRARMALSDLVREYKDIEQKCQQLAKHIDSYNRGEKYRPDHGEVETLYHATAYVTELVKNGFSSKRPAGHRGLGNYFDTDKISMTHNLKIAQDIMRSLKEIWMIVHGKLSVKTIIKWIIHDDIGPLDLIVQSANIRVPASEITDVKDIVKLYYTYISLSPRRVNPVITYVEEMADVLRDRKFEDIGIVACEVKMNTDDEYLDAEGEFRVNPEQVLTVTKFL